MDPGQKISSVATVSWAELLRLVREEIAEPIERTLERTRILESYDDVSMDARRELVSRSYDAVLDGMSNGVRMDPHVLGGDLDFREPSHVLFEIATLSPGFAVDEDPEHLGESLRLPTQHEHLRGRLEQLLTPLTNPRRAPRATTDA